jgi:hypothetical protein
VREQRLEQVALQRRRDGSGDGCGGHRGERFDGDDVAGHDQPDDL